MTRLNITIRKETPADYGPIDEVNRFGFGGEEEVHLVRSLRTDGDLLVSLVAELKDRVVGHILLSRMLIETVGGLIPAVALAPVAVLPEFQRQGVGSRLINQALELSATMGESVVLVLGHKTYYPKFGFSADLAKHLATPFSIRDDGAFMALELKPNALKNVRGEVRYPKAFGLDPVWTIKNGRSKTAITSANVVDLYSELNDLGIQIWIDGGWGVDALLRKQTRPHADLDIAIEQKNVPRLRQLLEARGYKDVPRDDTSAWNFVLGDGNGREVDVHAIVFDDEGNGLYGPIEKGVMYPAASLTGTGTIDRHTVKCISAEWTVKFHTGYTPRDTDFQHVSALCERFEIDYPKEYRNLKQHSKFR